MMRESVGTRLQQLNGIGPGFDFLRIALAITIVVNHSFLIVDGNFDYVRAHHLWAIFSLTLPMFFALSGFLISASAQRLRLHDFLLNRALRIVPALAVDISISALVIGPLFTVFPWKTYYTDTEFKHYFLNIVGFIHYLLPGVFLSNPFAGQVNGSLWTVPPEIGCYAIMTALIASGAIKSGRKLFAAFAAFTVCFYLALNYGPDLSTFDTTIFNYLRNFIGERGRGLYFYFLGGTLLYHFRHKVPYSPYLFALCVALCLLRNLSFFGPWKDILFLFPVSYMTAYIGLLPIRRLPLFSGGDYSYGIYLYGYPLQQMLIQLHPRLPIALHCLCSIVLATGVAMIS
jgi:peptidoglycan/LPS O-acetylase OafA/YrhL